MSVEHDTRHAELMERWQSEGSIAREALAELLACSRCGAEVRALAALVEALDAEGCAERDAEVAAAMALEEQPGFEAAERALRAAMAGRGRRRPGTLTLALFAAAAAAGAVFVLRRSHDSVGAIAIDGPTLLGAPIEILEPVGAVAEFERFAWSGDVPTARSQRLLVWDASDPAALPTNFGPLDAAAREWTPDESVRRVLPKRIRWRVSARDEHGEEVGASASLEAWRSPP